MSKESETARKLPVAGRQRRSGAGRLSRALRPPGVTVAIVGPDGSGKSTLAEAVAGTLELPASTQYMGLYQRVDGQRQGHAGLPTLVVTQLRRWLSARRRQAQGEVVLF